VKALFAHIYPAGYVATTRTDHSHTVIMPIPV